MIEYTLMLTYPSINKATGRTIKKERAICFTTSECMADTIKDLIMSCSGEQQDKLLTSIFRGNMPPTAWEIVVEEAYISTNVTFDIYTGD